MVVSWSLAACEPNPFSYIYFSYLLIWSPPPRVCWFPLCWPADRSGILSAFLWLCICVLSINSRDTELDSVHFHNYVLLTSELGGAVDTPGCCAIQSIWMWIRTKSYMWWYRFIFEGILHKRYSQFFVGSCAFQEGSNILLWEQYEMHSGSWC